MNRREKLFTCDDCGNTYLLKRCINWDNALILQEPNGSYAVVKLDICPISFSYNEVKTVGKYLLAFYKEEFKTKELYFHIYNSDGELLKSNGKKIVGRMYEMISIYGIKVLTEKGKILYIT